MNIYFLFLNKKCFNKQTGGCVVEHPLATQMPGIIGNFEFQFYLHIYQFLGHTQDDILLTTNDTDTDARISAKQAL